MRRPQGIEATLEKVVPELYYFGKFQCPSGDEEAPGFFMSTQSVKFSSIWKMRDLFQCPSGDEEAPG
jgi:hypothetical protein